MSRLLDKRPYDARDDQTLLAEMNALGAAHARGCAEYARLFPGAPPAGQLPELPFVHVGVFKHVLLKTAGENIQHERTLRSSSTSGQEASKIVLDRHGGALQAQSSRAILADFIGDDTRPLLVIDSAKSLGSRGEIAARVSAAMSLKPFASSIAFALADAGDPTTLAADRILEAVTSSPRLIVYGFSWHLWLFWTSARRDARLADAFRQRQVSFVHSGGWKKFEAERTDPATFDATLLAGAGSGSKVLDCYGLVEQNGILYPRCERGFRHAPRWAGVFARNPVDGAVVAAGERGLLQLFNPLAVGAPYHNVLTEDLGTLVDGDCSCGRLGLRFHLHGRLPKAEARGCANV